ncbi:MAG: hypothetical protein ACYT04_15675, partial [Nostoc sp.]
FCPKPLTPSPKLGEGELENLLPSPNFGRGAVLVRVKPRKLAKLNSYVKLTPMGIPVPLPRYLYHN